MLYEHILSHLLIESKIDSYTNELTRLVISNLKDEMNTINASKQTQQPGKVPMRKSSFNLRSQRPEHMNIPSGMPDSDGTNNLTLEIEVIVLQTNKDIVQINASWGGNILALQIYVSSSTGTLRPQHLLDVQKNIYETIRHELEHSTQDVSHRLSSIKSSMAMSNNPTSLAKKKNYYTDKAEMPAFVAGMYNKAKKLRIPFKDVAEENLEKITNSMLTHGAKPAKVKQTIDVIRKAWIDYAQTRFPKVMID